MTLDEWKAANRADNVTWLEVGTRCAINPEIVLEAAKGQLEHAAVLGWDTDGEIYVASSFAGCRQSLLETIHLISCAQAVLMDMLNATAPGDP